MICNKCGEPLQKEINLLGKLRYVPIACRCKREEMYQRERTEKAVEKQDRLKQLFTNSLMDKKFEIETFENWDFSKGQKSMYNAGIKYCKNFRKAKREGVGFILYGPPGNGKTYLSNCIANYLLSEMFPVICVGINQLLERIRKTYSRYGKEGEDTVLNGLALADLLILDDLGTEQLTDWSRSKVYNIIDSRYRNGLPIIVSTNKSIEELKEMYNERTVDRLLEICTPIKNTAPSIRKNKAIEKTNILMGIIKGE